ncbi:MAG: DOMON domain-containing protein [Dehalococcoidia bacterium]
MSNNYALRVLIAALIVALSVAACQAPSRPEPKSALPPSLPPPPISTQPEGPPVSDNVGWASDGVITAGEYRNSRPFDGYDLWWTSDDTYIYIGMKAKTQGWVAVGFDPESMMKDADIVQGFVKDGALSIADQYSTGQFGPHKPDVEQGGTDDILASGGKSDGGFTTIEFKRKLDTGDRFDKVLGKGTHKVIWAYGSDPQFTLKHASRGSAEIDL